MTHPLFARYDAFATELKAAISEIIDADGPIDSDHLFPDDARRVAAILDAAEANFDALLLEMSSRCGFHDGGNCTLADLAIDLNRTADSPVVIDRQAQRSDYLRDLRGAA